MTNVVARFRDVPPATFLPVILSPTEFSPVERDHNRPTSLRRGEGRLCIDVLGWRRAGVIGKEGGGNGKRKMNPTSTVDAVDDGFKLRSHAQ